MALVRSVPHSIETMLQHRHDVFRHHAGGHPKPNGNLGVAQTIDPVQQQRSTVPLRRFVERALQQQIILSRFQAAIRRRHRIDKSIGQILERNARAEDTVPPNEIDGEVTDDPPKEEASSIWKGGLVPAAAPNEKPEEAILNDVCGRLVIVETTASEPVQLLRVEPEQRVEIERASSHI